MPTLDWIGKNAVIRHHKEVPFRLLEPDEKLSCGGAETGNLIVQGDNLHALKALLPKYGGLVKCIYIDPPYNTGNDNGEGKGWIYNDNVNSPEIKRWLGQAVGKEAEDLSRHDKWLCMMFPRIFLLKELLAEDGLIAVSIDDNELGNCLALLDLIFLPANRVAICPWKAEPSGGKQKSGLRIGHEYLVIYHRKDKKFISMEEVDEHDYDLVDSQGSYKCGRELLKWGAESHRGDRETMWFPLTDPDGNECWPIRNDRDEGRWRLGKKNPYMAKVLKDASEAHWELRDFDDKEGKRWVPYEKLRQGTTRYAAQGSWLDKLATNAQGTSEIKSILGSKVFDTPKPVELISWVIGLVNDPDLIVLDSFAGSGTTGHAVLKQNAEDGGNRKFILIEMEEEIAQDITAKRVARVAGGYTNAKGEPVEGLGGGFQFCRLSDEPLFNEFGDIRDDVTFAQLADFVWFAETGEGYTGKADSPLLGSHGGMAVYLLFNGILGDRRPAGGNILTPAVLASLPEHDGLRVIYAAAVKGIGPAALARANIIFKQTPYAIEV